METESEIQYKRTSTSVKAKQIIINSIWFGVVPKLTTLINIFLLPIITPFLTPSDYGVIGIINSYSGIIAIIAVMGLNIHLTNSFFVYKERFRQIWGRVLGLLLISGLFFSICYAIFLYILFEDITGLKKILAVVSACIPILLIANLTLAQHYYPLVQKPKSLVLRNLIGSISGMLVTFCFIYYLKLGYLGWLAGAATSSLVCFVLFIHPLWVKEKIKPIFIASKKRVYSWLKISLPIVPHSLGFVLLASSNRIIMSLLNIDIDDIGIYTNGYIMGDYAIVLSSAMIVAVSPRVQELYRSQKFIDLKKLYIFCQLSAFLISFLFSIWMPEIYKLLIHNDALQPAHEIAIFICFANVVFPFYSFLATTAFIEERTGKVLWLVFIPASLNILLNLIFIPLYGYKAAIYTTLVAYWSQTLIPYTIKYFREKSRIIFSNIYLPLMLLSALVIIVICANIISELSVICKLLISVICGSSFIFYSIKNKKY